MVPIRRAAAALALAALLVAGPAAAETRRSFGAVAVTCSDDLTCVAAIEDDGAEPGSLLKLTRSNGSRSRWTISIVTRRALADRDRPVQLSVDNGVGIRLQPASDFAPFVTANEFFILSQNALDRLMVRLRPGQYLRFSYMDIAGAPHTDRFPLNGLAAALTDIDEQQGRVTGDRRTGPPEGLPPAPPVDRQAMVAADGVPPRLLDWHRAGSNCEAVGGPSIADVPAVIGPLSPTAMLYAIPCYRSGARAVYRLYLVESGEIGGMQVLVFAIWSPRFGWTGTDTLHQVAYDPQTRRLTAEALDAEGCGSRGVWTFDEFAFRIDRYEVAEDCGGSGGPTWRPVWPPA